MILSTLLDDARFTLRSLSRSSGFLFTSVLMLGLAIGVLASMFSVVHSVLLRPLPYAEPDQLVYLAGSAPGTALGEEFPLAREFEVHFAEHSQMLAGVGRYNGFTNSLRVGDRVERIPMSSPSASLFSALGVAPLLGRLPGAQDAEPVVVLSERLWSDWFGRDPAVIGSSVQVFGAPREVIAVMPAAFGFPDDNVLLWITRQVDAGQVGTPGNFGGGTLARIKPGADPAALAAELGALSKALPARFGGSAAYAEIIERMQVVVRPLREQMLGSLSRPLWLLFGAAGLVLLIACTNLTNLFMVRAETRQRELAVRHALGAGRFALLRLRLLESAAIGLLAGGLAALIALALQPLILRWAPVGIPRLADIGMDLATLGFTLAVALLSSLLCGVLPSLRGAAPKLERLREGGRGMTARQHWMRQGLVALQTALALTLLIGAGLLLRSVQALHAVDPGYQPEGIFTFQFAPEQASLSDAPSWARFHLSFLERLAALPGVEGVGLIENVPLNEGPRQLRARTESMAQPAASGALINLTYTAGDYFRTMGIELVAGRVFAADDHQGRGNILVSRRAAEQLWPGEDPLGKRLQREDSELWETVVGVVDDVQQFSMDGTPQPLIYLPLVGPDPAMSPSLSSPAWVVKSNRPDTISGEIRQLVKAVAPEAPMYRQFTLSQLVDDSMSQLRFTLLTLGLAALMALVLGVIGLYGVLSYAVTERTREIGVRVALGARVQQVVGMIVAQGTRVVGIGVVAGLVCASLLSHLLSGLLFGVAPFDPTTFAVTTVAMLAVGLLASYLPARRAARLDPMESLRSD